MSRIMSPWELAYTKLKEHYSKDQIDDMLWCEIEELLIREERDAKKIEDIASGVAIHMQELLEDTVDWQMDDLPHEKRQELIKLSVEKLQSLIS